MDSNSVASLYVPQLIAQTTNLCNDLNDHTSNLDPETKNELYNEVSSWMILLEAINQVHLPSDDGARDLVEEGQTHCSKYAIALSGINQNLQTVKSSWDAGMSFMAIQEVQTLRGSLQTQREEMEKWLADIKLASGALNGVHAQEPMVDGLQEPFTEILSQPTAGIQQDPVAHVLQEPSTDLPDSATETQQQPVLNVQEEASTDIPQEPVSNVAGAGGKNKKKKNKKKKKGQQAVDAVQEPVSDVPQDKVANFQQEAVPDVVQQTGLDGLQEPITEDHQQLVTDIEQEPVLDVVQPIAANVLNEPVTEDQQQLVTKIQQEPISDMPPQPVVDIQQEPVLDVVQQVADVLQEPITEDQQQPVSDSQQTSIPDIPQEPAIDLPQESATDILQEPVVDIQSDLVSDTPQEPVTGPQQEPTTDIPQEPAVDIQLEPVTDTPQEPESDVQPEPATDTLQEPVVDIQPEPATDIPQEPVVDIQPEPVTDTLQEPVVDIQPEPVADSPQGPVVDIQSEPVTDAPQEPVVDIQSEPVTDAPQEPVVDIQSEPVTDAPQEPVVDIQSEPVTDAPQEPVVDIQSEPVTDAPQEPVVEIQQEPAMIIQQEPVSDVLRQSTVDIQQESVAECRQLAADVSWEPAPADLEQSVSRNQQWTQHGQAAEKLRNIGAIMESMAVPLDTLITSNISSQELSQARELLAQLINKSKSEFQTFSQEFDHLFTTIGENDTAKQNRWHHPEPVMVEKNLVQTFMERPEMMDNSIQTDALPDVRESETKQNIDHASNPHAIHSIPIGGAFESTFSTFDASETVQNDASTVWATPLWAPSQVPDDMNGEQNVFDYLDQATTDGIPDEHNRFKENFLHSQEFAAEIPELSFSAVRTIEIVPPEIHQVGSVTDSAIPKISELVVSDIQAIDIEPIPEPDLRHDGDDSLRLNESKTSLEASTWNPDIMESQTIEAITASGFTNNPDSIEPTIPNNSLIQNQTAVERSEMARSGVQIAEVISSSDLDESKKPRQIFDAPSSEKLIEVVIEKPEMIHNSTQTIEVPSSETSAPAKTNSSLVVSDRKDRLVQRARPHIGSDFTSRSIIAKDTQRVSEVFSKIIAGSFKKTGVSLGVIEVDGKDWASRFCEEHRYLNGILMAITIPKRLFLWHTLNFPVDEDSWTKGSLVRTVSMVTESPRHLHSYPFRITKNMPAGQPKLLLHWDLQKCGEPEVSARFKELATAGGELQRRMGSFSYKQMAVCITLPWSLVQGQIAGKIPDHQDKALEFLEDMGILSAIPVDETINGHVRERNWCPSSLKLGGSEQSITAYLQETTFTGSPTLDPPVQATPTRFMVVTIRKGEVDDWLDAVGCSLGMNSRSIRYPVSNKAPLDFNHLEKYYRDAINPNPSASRVG